MAGHTRRTRIIQKYFRLGSGKGLDRMSRKTIKSSPMFITSPTRLIGMRVFISLRCGLRTNAVKSEKAKAIARMEYVFSKRFISILLSGRSVHRRQRLNGFFIVWAKYDISSFWSTLHVFSLACPIKGSVIWSLLQP